jgi:hypothetical protein
MGCTVDNSFRVQSKQRRGIDDADDTTCGINEVDNMTILLSGFRGQPHSATDLLASSENE